MSPDLEPDFSKIPPPRSESFLGGQDAAAYFQAGLAAERQGDTGVALAAYDACLALDPTHADACNNRGNALLKLRQAEAALDAFAQACALRPTDALFHNNCAVVLSQLQRHGEALTILDAAIALDPGMARAHHNRAVALMNLARAEEALAAFATALRLDPRGADTYVVRSRFLMQLGRPEAAAADSSKALALAPATPWLAGDHLHQKMLICDWSDFANLSATICGGLARGEPVCSPFSFLSVSDDPLAQRTSAALWSRQFPRDASLGTLPPRKPGKIRVGYFSQDFREHAVASLIAGVIEAHDRTDFEVIAFSYGPDTGDAMRKRLEKAFDRFIDIRAMSDRAAATLARELGIDIAVDLSGYTGRARTGIFALQVAPVQINAIGYPGTMARDDITTIIADPVLIPPAERAAYSEQVVDLACFQANDRRRAIAPATPDRATLGLPPDAFVFCSFNKSYKFNPTVFDGWMRILTQVDGAVLWLFAESKAVIANLRREAQARGVDPARLVLASPVAQPEHLARHRAADLFLDTWPYNAHTTASDALWAGLPVLTRAGRSFAARVATSLLTAVGLTELVTATSADYEALAVTLARDPRRLQILRDRLAANRETSILFDTARYTKDLEDAYRRILKV